MRTFRHTGVEHVNDGKPRKKLILKPLLIGCGTIVMLVIVILVVSFWPVLRPEGLEMSPYHPFRSAKAKEEFLKLYDARAKEWPVESEARTVATSYGQTFVRISGPVGAPPLVLLHGGGGNSLHWMPNIEALAEHYRVYAVDDIYGHGRSVYTRTMETSYDVVSWLDELFIALGLGDNINLVGLSYGGWQTSRYALSFPHRLDKIVLLAPAGTILPLRLEWVVRAVLCTVPHRYFTRSMMYWLLEDAVHKDEATRIIVDEWVTDSFTAVRCFKPKRLVNPTVLDDAEWRSIEVPGLYLVGENEKIYSSQMAVERLDRVAPHIEAEIIPDAGHDLTVVQTEMVNRKVLEFLKRP
jgi:pimeloyl-ACP methyl ester carboxylesterase